MDADELADQFNTDSRRFRRRWDVDRMETDTAYRDSVRRVIIDSLERHNPDFRERMRKRREERNNNGDDNAPTPTETNLKNTAMRDEREENTPAEERRPQ